MNLRIGYSICLIAIAVWILIANGHLIQKVVAQEESESNEDDNLLSDFTVPLAGAMAQRHTDRW